MSLDTMHEKEMHFVLVSNDMEKYYHLHPQKKHEGLFIIQKIKHLQTMTNLMSITIDKSNYNITPN
ncbi:hypothetical protein APW65_15005 (plasmid) [Staphylococcus aureus]|nr:hypothetical protein APW65_15005 [Staphylococcus aureus]